LQDTANLAAVVLLRLGASSDDFADSDCLAMIALQSFGIVNLTDRGLVFATTAHFFFANVMNADLLFFFARLPKHPLPNIGGAMQNLHTFGLVRFQKPNYVYVHQKYVVPIKRDPSSRIR
jgi:hypothetical protein